MVVLGIFKIVKSSFKWYNKKWSKASSYQEKEPKMIISESREKVKKKVRNFCLKLKFFLSKPQGKFIMEMLMGILTSGSANLTEIARVLREKTKIKQTLKRL